MCLVKHIHKSDALEKLVQEGKQLSPDVQMVAIVTDMKQPVALEAGRKRKRGEEREKQAKREREERETAHHVGNGGCAACLDKNSPSGNGMSVQSLGEGQQHVRRLVLDGLSNDRMRTMGVYELIEGKMVNGRAVWQLQGKDGGQRELFLYYACCRWMVGKRGHMESGFSEGKLHVTTTALSPDQHSKSSGSVWSVFVGGKWVEAAGVTARLHVVVVM
jgi:hypothetical protein